MLTDCPLALFFAPPPPPPGGVPGGIAAITAVLMRELDGHSEIRFLAPVGKEKGGRFGLRRSVENVKRLTRGTLDIHRRGTVLFFSSAGLSFWEKCAWSIVVRLLGRRVVVVMVDGNFPRYFESLRRPLRALARAVFRDARLSIGAQSRTWQHYFEATFPGTCVKVVSASVDREFLSVPPSARETTGRLHALYVGWVIKAKGVLDLLDAAAIVAADSDRAFSVRLVGPLFGEAETWRQEVERRGLGDVVELVGTVVDRAELLHAYRDADLFLFPSHFEGFPMAMLEAVAVGLPCIGSSVGGIPDILDHGRAGVVVPAHSPSALAAALRTLLEDDDLRARLGAAARRHAQAEYTHDACVSSYLRILGLR